MSTGGLPGIGPMNFASSVAGSQSRSVDESRSRTEAAQANAPIGAKAFADRALGDVAEAGQSTDRDADGRSDDGSPLPQAPATAAPHPSDPNAPRAEDAFGERGQQLDLEG